MPNSTKISAKRNILEFNINSIENSNFIVWSGGEFIPASGVLGSGPIKRVVPAGETITLEDTYSMVVVDYYDVDGILDLQGDAVLDVLEGDSDAFVRNTGDTMTGALTIDVNALPALLVEQSGVHDNTFVVDTTNGRIGVGTPTPAGLVEFSSSSVNMDGGVILAAGGLTAKSTYAAVNVTGELITFFGSNVWVNVGLATERFDTSKVAWAFALDNRAAFDYFNIQRLSAAGVQTYPLVVKDDGAFGFGPITNPTNFTGGKFVMDSSGNVGLGEIAPTARFHVVGNADIVQQIIKANSSQAANVVEIQDSSANVDISFLGGGASFNAQLNDADFIIAGDTEANLFRVDAGLDAVRIGDWDTNYVEVDKAGDMVFVGGAGLPFGEIYAQDNSTATTISGTGIANKVQITIFDTNGVSNNMTPDHTNDHITVTKAGMYLATVSISIAGAGGDTDDFGYSLWKNNGATEFGNVHAHRFMSGGAGDRGSISMNGITDLAMDDTIEVWCWNEDDTDNITVDDITLSLVMVGGT